MSQIGDLKSFDGFPYINKLISLVSKVSFMLKSKCFCCRANSHWNKHGRKMQFICLLLWESKHAYESVFLYVGNRFGCKSFSPHIKRSCTEKRQWEFKFSHNKKDPTKKKCLSSMLLFCSFWYTISKFSRLFSFLLRPEMDTEWTYIREPIETNSMVLKGLLPDTEYQFVVRAVNMHGVSPPSQINNPVRTLGKARHWSLSQLHIKKQSFPLILLFYSYFVLTK